MIDLKAGDIILYKGNKFISKAIRLFMEEYRVKLGLPKRQLYNHAAMVIEVWGRMYVAEANAKGITISPYEDTYAKVLDQIKIISPKKVYSKAEKELISKTATAYAFDPTRYDFLNFLFQIDMIRKQTKNHGKEWGGPTGSNAERRLYCTEAVATWANKVRPDTFSEPWTVNPLDVDLNKYYKVIFNGIEK
jgi:hypothetical protein